MLLSSSPPASPTLTLPAPLTPDQLERAVSPLDIRISPEARARAAACQVFLTGRLASGAVVYGASTGFGPLVGYGGRTDAAEQCDNALAHLGCGQGADLPVPVVRATLLVRLASLTRGHSAVTPEVLDALAAALRTGFTPAVPRLGSVGASGDLIPLAHAVQALRGRGRAYFGTTPMPAAAALDRAGLRPLVLDGRDALALVNGTSLTSAAAALALARLRRAHTTALRLTALLADLLGSTPGFAASPLLDAFGHPDAVRAGAALRGLLAGIVPTGRRPLQEPYSIRCTPQLLGAVGSSLRHAEEVIGHDLRGVSDNPLCFPELDEIAHGGNFFGQPVAFAADLLTLAAVQTGNLAERQLDLLIDPHRNGGLPPMLAPEPGRQHAVQGVQLAATAILAQMRRTATPASIQSLPTNGHNQDVVPFGTQAALGALDQAESLRLLHGSLAVALRQAAHVGARRPTAPACVDLLDHLCATVPAVDPDRPLDADVRAAADLLDGLPQELPV
ncbi:HAL/PAL/TAL family ammonia-lyase [Streptomyces ureilyticus]|uniref:Aromatic amino acid lyase n=1 Tax=Streptomyces ureilyticus TaxID=1775131 RepID=A0ABX0E584_9ACTN|nr:aromatic amino acid ammonia-lyase [Streptomyces ureilyticus]NGO48585.1 aromatic amino acid lyase [Streptomyces ureilyticus]